MQQIANHRLARTREPLQSDQSRAEAERLRLRLIQEQMARDTFEAARRPPVDRQEINNDLWEVARVPDHALDKLSKYELAAAYREVVAAAATPGEHELKLGKYRLEMQVDSDGQVVRAETRKKGFFSKLGSVLKKVGGVALQVASFIPGPIGIAARIGSAVVAAIKGIKNKSFFGAVAGVAGAVAGGAGMLFKGATAGAAVAVGKAAGIVENGARAAQAAIDASRARSVGGVLGSIATGASAAAGMTADLASGVSESMSRVARWARGGQATVQGVESARRGDLLGAASAGLSGAGIVSQELGQSELARNLHELRRFPVAARNVQRSVEHADYLGAARTIAGFAAAEAEDPELQSSLRRISSAIGGAQSVIDAATRGDALATARAAASMAGELTGSDEAHEAALLLGRVDALEGAITRGDLNSIRLAVGTTAQSVQGVVETLSTRHFPVGQIGNQEPAPRGVVRASEGTLSEQTEVAAQASSLQAICDQERKRAEKILGHWLPGNAAAKAGRDLEASVNQAEAYMADVLDSNELTDEQKLRDLHTYELQARHFADRRWLRDPEIRTDQRVR